MWQRTQFKFRARQQLKAKYGEALAVVVLTTLIVNALKMVVSLLSNLLILRFDITSFDVLSDQTSLAQLIDMLQNRLRSYVNAIDFGRNLWLGLALVSLAFLLYSILVGYAVEVGMHRFFLRSTHIGLPPRVGIMFSCFKGGAYGPTMVAMLWRGLWSFIWALPWLIVTAVAWLPSQLVALYAAVTRQAVTEGLVIRVARLYNLPMFLFSKAVMVVGGVLSIAALILIIHKRYRYRMVPFLLADNPALGARRALNLSKRMTKGHVFRMFMLDMSFLGWILLCIMCICVPWLTLHLLLPYVHMTWANAYVYFRDRLVADGEVTMEELGYVRAS